MNISIISVTSIILRSLSLFSSFSSHFFNFSSHNIFTSWFFFFLTDGLTGERKVMKQQRFWGLLSVVLVVVGTLSERTAGSMKLVRLEEAAATEGAVCLDGSAAAYYFGAATRAQDADKWVLYFQSGGWCYKPEDCLERSRTNLGSSRGLAATITPGGILSASAKENPDFCTWNRVVLVYCDGASFAGDAAAPDVVNGTALYYRGYRNLRAVLADLAARHGLRKATQVLLTGASAGGLATVLHADQVRALLPRTVRRYKAAAMSGVFLAHANLRGEAVYEAQMRRVFAMQNASAGVAPACLAAKGAQHKHECLFAADALDHVATPVFVMNSVYDKWSLRCILTAEPVDARATQNGNCSALPGWRACISDAACTAEQLALLDRAWGDDFRATVAAHAAFARTGNGLYAYSCIDHGAEILGKWNQIAIHGVTIRAALTQWFFSDNEPAAAHTYTDCTLNGKYQCNPTCTL